MGEWSKTIGERGEEIVAILVKLLGWGDNQHELKVDCSKPENHAINGATKRETHGVDFLFTYASPLCDDMRENLIISSKYSSNSYPSSPATLFKAHYLDLTGAVACFKKSPLLQEQINRFPGLGITRNTGILFWLNNVEPESDCTSEVCKIDTPKTTDEYEGIYLVDNALASFLFDAISYVRTENGAASEFLYIETGKYTNPATKKFTGHIMPVEYLNLGLIPMKSIRSNGVERLSLCCRDCFSESDLGRLIGLSQSISQGWANEIVLLFPDYNPLTHDNIVGAVKNAFSDANITSKITVGCYRPKLFNQTNAQ